MRPTLVRALVLDVFARVVERKELADRALNRALRAHPELHSVERRKVAEGAYAMVRLLGRLDFMLERAASALKLPPPTSYASPDRDKLRYAAALVDALDTKPAEAASFASADGRYLKAFERIAAGTIEWPEEPIARLAAERSLPYWLAKRLSAEFGADADALATSLNSRAPLTLRANTLKATRDEVIAKLAEEELPAKAGALSPWAITLEERANVFGLKAWKSGLFEVQDEGSQLIALASGAKAGELVVDACTGGGGKALALAAMMQNKGRVIAIDVTEERMEDLKPRARQAGVFLLDPKVIPAHGGGDKLVAKLAKRADAVLVDAPCSGTGALRRNPDARWRLTEEELAAFPALQLAILERYAAAVKPGGRLVYATCSILAAENDGVAAAFAEKHPEFRAVALDLPATVLDAAGRLKTRPDKHGTDGFFAAGFIRE